MQRHETLTFEEFSEHWRVAHPPLFLKTQAVKENILKYEQLHVNQEWKQRLLEAGMKVPDYDGIVVVEAETLEKALSAFSGPEYIENVLPDSMMFCNLATVVYRAFQVTTFFDKSPDTTPDSQIGVIRKDVESLLVNVHTKDGSPESARYWREVHMPKIISLMESTGVGASLTKCEQLTVDPDIGSGTLAVPITPTTWDGASVIEAPGIGQILEAYKDQSIIDFAVGDAPNFVDVTKPSEYLPCNVVTFRVGNSRS
ncbi:hypothetical protein V5O48_001809 [Marasmius crinis-equi]|uniref:EthD domain-containing protein n=1 Tax=Marasmius crinis-equi TaxID=585013 RepID=A0ABR3FYL7_9AGAR